MAGVTRKLWRAWQEVVQKIVPLAQINPYPTDAITSQNESYRNFDISPPSEGSIVLRHAQDDGGEEGKD